MKNRAKCKLCSSIIESFHSSDLMTCKCGEISVFGGDSLYCSAENWSNFLRVDDQGNEIIVHFHEGSEAATPTSKPSRKELIAMLDEMAKNIERLPETAMTTPINHYDYLSLILLLSTLFKSDEGS